jgi:hypothetical protein
VSRNTYWKFQPNGGSAYRLTPNSTAAANTRPTSSPIQHISLEAGDSVIINVDTGHAAQLAWAYVIERDA